ncbi:MAG: cache domain-containing protein [Bacteroidales bacterium]|nr:cache domain-containing protein [Bacteroidales bacterium]
MNGTVRRILIALFAAALALVAASFVTSNPTRSIQHQAGRMERALHKREKVISSLSDAIISGSINLEDEENLPEDIVIYHYKNDSLHCWHGLFPISNDDIFPNPMFYRLHHLVGDNSNISPLAYLENESYTNIGSRWYFVKTYSQGSDYLISAVLVKNEFSSESLSYANTVNSKLKLDSKYTTVPLYTDAGAIVHSISGKPLLSIVAKSNVRYGRRDNNLLWGALLLLLAAVILWHSTARSLKSYGWYILATALLLLGGARTLVYVSDDTLPLFSPLTFADSSLVNSPASLLINNLFIFLVVLGLFICRAKLWTWFKKLSPRAARRAAVLSWVTTAFLVAYTHITFRSLILNSNIPLNLSRVTTIKTLTIVFLVSYGSLFLALLHSLQMSITASFGRRVVNLYNWWTLSAFLVAVSLYSVIMINTINLRKEFESNRVWCDKLYVERDLSLESFLRMMENDIANDHIISALSFWPQQGTDFIRSRILERYMYRGFTARYNLSVAVCDIFTPVTVDRNTPEVNCISHYGGQITRYGIPIAPGSHFHYLNDYNGQVSYLGEYTFVDYHTFQSVTLFLILESRFQSDDATDIAGILSTNHGRLAGFPRHYSYAKYMDGRLVAFSGRASFPSSLDMSDYKEGYYTQRTPESIRFINKYSEDELIIISRPSHKLLRNLSFFSYLLVLYGIIVFLGTRRRRHNSMFAMPSHTYKRRIIIFMGASLIGSLLCLGIGTIALTLRRNKISNERQMTAAMQIVQSTLSEYCQYALRYTDVTTPQLLAAMNTISANTKNEINLFDTKGMLIGTTQPELYYQSVLGTRMAHFAHRAITAENKMNYICEESVAGKKYYSIYAPLFNIDGKLVAIVNIPYINSSRQIKDESIMMVTGIANIYLLILILSVFLGLMLANSISKPLTGIRNAMESLSLNKKSHIHYGDPRDEIGMLVAAYNKMVDELDESSRQLAQREREQAWKEMARQIAHEIKNPLTPMKLSIQHLQRIKNSGAPGWENDFDRLMKSLLEQIEILSTTAGEFSSFAKFYNEEITDEDLISIIHEEMILFSNDYSVPVELDAEIAPAPIRIRKKQIMRVFTNLISNAQQALEAREDGKIKIRITQGEPLAYRIYVEDNGPGVSPDNLEKLFKPNFTTKSSGTGLGLAICRSIIEQSGGTIHYETSPLGGAAFVMELPLA